MANMYMGEQALGTVVAVLNTADATATAADIAKDKTAYVGNKKIVGTHECATADELLAPLTKDASDLTASGAQITVSAGYYPNDVSKSVATTTLAEPRISVDSTGSVTASYTQSAGYVEEGTKSVTNKLSTQAGKTVTPNTSEQTAVSSGVFTTGDVKVAGDANLVPENIAEGVSIFGVQGSHVSGVVLPSLSNPATAENIDSGYEAIDALGNLITGIKNVVSGTIFLEKSSKTVTIPEAIGKKNIMIYEVNLCVMQNYCACFMYLEDLGVGHTYYWGDSRYLSRAEQGTFNSNTGTLTAEATFYGTDYSGIDAREHFFVAW